MTTLTSIPPAASLKPRKTLAILRKEFMAFLDEELIGQPKAKKLALRIFNQIYNPLRDPNKPIFSAILAGESRTGKTLLAKLFAKWFHGRENAMVRVDGGEFIDTHYISRVIGAPPSYTGYVDPRDAKDPKKALAPEDIDPSALISQHNLDRSKLGSENDVVILLLDEFEKFPAQIIALLLKGLDDGEATLSNNTTINLRNVVIFFTANLGMRELANKIWGFSQNKTQNSVIEAVQDAYKQFTTPEFRNRVDALLIYESLGRGDLSKIVEVESRRLNKFIIETTTVPAFEIAIKPEAIEFLLDLTFAGEGNLGNLKRVMQEHVREKLGEMYNDGEIKLGMRFDITVEDGALKFVPIKHGMKLVDMLGRRSSGEVLTESLYEALLRTSNPDEVLPLVSRVLATLAEANVTVESTEFAKEGSMYIARLYFNTTSVVIEKLSDGLTGQPLRFSKLTEKVERYLGFITHTNEAPLKTSRREEFYKLLNEADVRIIKTGPVSKRDDMTHYELAGPSSKFTSIENRLKAIGFQSFRKKETDE